jgi:uncharacterized membrane protein YjfL (UPF0719 family)
MFPVVSPNETLYMVCGSIFTLLVSPVNYAPLVPDYVHKDSIGKAVAFSLMGISLGVVASLGVLFEYTKDLDPLISWRIMGAVMLIFAIGMLLMISEPPERVCSKDGMSKRIKTLSVNSYKACKYNHNLILGLLLEMFSGGPMVIFEIYIMSWLNGFYNEQTGPIFDH